MLHILAGLLPKSWEYLQRSTEKEKDKDNTYSELFIFDIIYGLYSEKMKAIKYMYMYLMALFIPDEQELPIQG